MPDNRRFAIRFGCAFLPAVLLFATPAIAEPTPVTVRVISQDAKFVGDSTGGAQVILRDAESGHILAEGITAGGTGNTDRIMQSTGRSPLRATDDAAAFHATLDLVRPTLVELQVKGALGRPGSAVKVTAQRWMMPGVPMTAGDGWSIELPGLAVIPTASIEPEGLRITAKVEPMCGCPLTPGGLWNAADYEVEASLWQDGHQVRKAGLAFATAPGGFTGTLPLPTSGRYTLVLLARAEEAATAPLDIFIGMVIADGENLALERCNLSRTRYRLLPAAGAGDPLAELRGKTGKIQAQVIASYRADGEAHILDVAAIDNVRLGKTCHLLDAIDESFEKAEASAEASPEAAAAAAAAEAGEASNPDADRWVALAAGAAAPAGGEVIGSGAYAYRFVLRHPRTGKLAADTDFALSASRATDYELPFVTDEKKVFQGRTDGEGRTPVFRLPVRLPDAAFDLRERFGSGPYGETFHLTDPNGNDLFNMPYVLITCTSPPRFFRGYTYRNGDTA